MNRPDLFALVGQRVTITGPGHADPLTGMLTALADHPTLILDLDDGQRRVFRQDRCKVTSADELPEPSQPMPAEPPRKSNAQWERLAIREPNGDITYTWPNVPPTADLVTGDNVAQLLDRQLDRLAATLHDSLARLDAHIDQRAHEIAAPRIIAVEERAAEQLAVAREEAGHWRDRFTDLQYEYRRQLQVADRRAVRAETAIARALATLALNAQLQADDRGYQACADHVTTALNGTTDQEGTPA